MKNISAAILAAVFSLGGAAALAESPRVGWMESIRFMTYNIQYCGGDANRTAAKIIAAKPDFCCINEVHDHASSPQGTTLANLTGMHKSFFGNTSQGNMILSKEAPLSTAVFDLPYANWRRFLGVAEFTNFVVAVTHLDTGANSFEPRTNSFEILRNVFSEYAAGGRPVILCGDMNCPPGSQEIALMKKFMTILSPVEGARTYHARSPEGGSIIDYIAVDTVHAGGIVLKDSFVVEDIETSDHNPVIVDFYRRPAADELGWIDETFLSTGRKGTWAGAIEWDEDSWRAGLGGAAEYTCASPSDGNIVTVDIQMAFDDVPDDPGGRSPSGGVQGAFWLGPGGVFQVWTREGWRDVAAPGVAARAGVEYSLRFRFDYGKGTYSVSVLDGGSYKPFEADGESEFPLASSGGEISSIAFDGDGSLASIFGEYVEVEGFRPGEALALKNNAVVILDAARAAWLDKLGGKRDVAAKAADVSREDFDGAWLCNLDITRDFGFEFKIASVEVGESVVAIGVSLVREGKVDQAVNGRLVFYGAATLEAFKSGEAELLGAASIDGNDSSFSKGDTATATIPLGEGAKAMFYKAAIE